MLHSVDGNSFILHLSIDNRFCQIQRVLFESAVKFSNDPKFIRKFNK